MKNYHPDDHYLNSINSFLKTHGISLNYRSDYLLKMIKKRMKANNCSTYFNYFIKLQKEEKEINFLREKLSINYTEFFRNKKSFAFIENILSSKLDNITKKKFIIWSAGCSYGPEAYTITMILKELIESKNIDIELIIYATDINETSLSIAKDGIFSISLINNVPKKYFSKYFENIEINTFKVKDTIIDSIKWINYDLTTPTFDPFTEVDLILCRNVLIYFERKYQFEIVMKFHKSLSKDGILFIGGNEHFYDKINTKFITISPIHQIFEKNISSKKQKQFLCKFCGLKFLDGNSFEIHVNQHKQPESDKVVIVAEGNFICKSCNKGFKTESRWRAHMRYHLKNKV